MNKTMRCAIYTRKSTEEGLDQAYNTLDAQRDAGMNYINSMVGEGWVCLPTKYDDGGFTGANMDRPGLKRLLADIAAGDIDVVVVYKVDRLSRSLLDFARLIETFDQHQVAFVSVTQQFHTGNSMGRLVLNVLLSFAQFEREMISERTRDKIAATRKKGKWTGGYPILGYVVDPNATRLVVEPYEADQVHQIFQLYAEQQSLLSVVQEIDRRGWVNKQWRTHGGNLRGGLKFTRTSLHKMLTNITYLGKIRHKTDIYQGEHTGIIEPDLWERVQSILKRNGRTASAMVRNKFGALLKGILHCAHCNCAMTPTHTTRGGKRYRYYICSSAQKIGRSTCSSGSLPAAQIEDLVVQQLQILGQDEQLHDEVLVEIQRQDEEQRLAWKREKQTLENRIRGWQRELKRQSGETGTELRAWIRIAEKRLQEITLNRRWNRIDRNMIQRALQQFDRYWHHLTLQDQIQLLHLLVERVTFDGDRGKIAIAFHPTGISSLMDRMEQAEMN
ncbi:MAG: recombinase family protein [Zavarzinella sp.]